MLACTSPTLIVIKERTPPPSSERTKRWRRFGTSFFTVMMCVRFLTVLGGSGSVIAVAVDAVDIGVVKGPTLST